MVSQCIVLCAGTLLVKDGSHSGHEQFFATESVLTEEEKLTTADFYQFHPQVTNQAALPHLHHCVLLVSFLSLAK